MADADLSAVPPMLFQQGKSIGVSDWMVVDQDMITQFGKATRDDDPMHMDRQWAQTHSPYGDTIAFGFLSISLLTCLLYSALNKYPSREPDAGGSYHNYGFDRLRLITPVPVGARVRGRFSVLSTQRDDKGRERVVLAAQIEIEGVDKPALVAEWLTIWVPRESVS